MLDFTSSHYLGLKHGSALLEPWDELTTGVPAALREPPGAEEVAATLAALTGCGRGLLLASTLHLFWDLFGLLARPGRAIHWDAGLYPTARWGVERAAALGAVTYRFHHHDPEALEWRMTKDGPGRRPVVVSDGFCAGCGRSAPLREYVARARARGGLLVIDDTQALGLYGSPAAGMPFGRGGGGSLPRWGIGGSDVVVGASLAKALGVPLAVLAGDETVIRGFEHGSETRVHCSPPSAAVVHAASRALRINAAVGDVLRQRLAEHVLRFREGLELLGMTAVGGLFPVQRVLADGPRSARALSDRLLEGGVQTVLQRSRCTRETRVTFVITASHEGSQIDRALHCLAMVANASSLHSHSGAAARG